MIYHQGDPKSLTNGAKSNIIRFISPNDERRCFLRAARRTRASQDKTSHERPARLDFSYRQLVRIKAAAEGMRAASCVDRAVRLVERHKNLPSDFWISRRRFDALVQGRFLVLYLTHVVAQVSMRQLSTLSGLDRKSIRYSLAQIEDKRESPAFDDEIETLSIIYQRLLKQPGFTT